MSELMHELLAINAAAVTVTGGATPTATSAELNLEHAAGPVSLILYGTASTDLSVTYQLGYQRVAGTTTWLTPADGGTITDLTNTDVSTTNQHHGTFNLPSGTRFRFTITNNDAVNADTVSLYLFAIEST